MLEQDKSCIKIVQGYSRDHRPELNQVVLNLMTSNQGNLPLYMQAVNGNSSDKTAFTKIIEKHITSFKAAVHNIYIVGDSALYTQKSLHALQTNKSLFVTGVPALHKGEKEAIASIKKEKLLSIGEGYFVLSINDLNCETFPPQKVLKTYRV